MGWLSKTFQLVLKATHLDPQQSPLNSSHHDNAVSSIAPRVFTPSITCEYPELEAQGWEFCNDETSRDCWLKNSDSQYGIKTKYETMSPKGVTREYWVEIKQNDTVSPDGFPKIQGQYINGTYPGPLLEACWGDQIVVHVTNNDLVNGTTIHWHGLRQLGTNEMDGVNGVTQCPIAPGDTFTYNFTAAQYGHTWYHSHYSLQYPDGVAAPLVIYGPSSADWSIDLGPVLIADWVHDTAYRAYEVEMTANVPPSDSIVINGRGRQNGTQDRGSYYEALATPNKTHIMRLINGGIGTSFVFSIDGHNLTVVGNDLVAIEPFTVQSLFIGIGQRYDVIVNANQDASQDYWIRTTPATGCTGFGDDPIDNKTGIFRYDASRTALPTSEGQPNQDLACLDVDPSKLNPIVPWEVDMQPQNNVSRDTFDIELQDAADEELGPPGSPYRHWKLGERPLWLDFENPTILNAQASINNPNYTVVTENFTEGFIYLIVDASHLPVAPAHPIHLHGSDFVILAQDTSPWNETASPSLFNFDNPPRRDTAIVPAGGFLALAFRPDNPGAWLLHCHIAWHASSGLALQILVQPDNMRRRNGNLDETRRVCKNWAESDLRDLIQIDSGI
ncbi:multicopper oxidase [Poronia punctata]|nr:multicopper oxidase [Poronia punctata]